MSWRCVSLLFAFLVILAACAPSSDSSPPPINTDEVDPTSTPAVIFGSASATPKSTSRCGSLNGLFELQLLVGPAEAVGLEPVAIGDIPFSIESTGESFTLEGASAVSYEDVLEQEWGTYSVSLNMDITLGGLCVGEEGSEQLMVDFTMSGDQVVVVEAEGFQGEYPWSGSHELELVFPLQEGAAVEGEGWLFVLHINQ